jgi:hypothetical protein
LATIVTPEGRFYPWKGSWDAFVSASSNFSRRGLIDSIILGEAEMSFDLVGYAGRNR